MTGQRGRFPTQVNRNYLANRRCDLLHVPLAERRSHPQSGALSVQTLYLWKRDLFVIDRLRPLKVEWEARVSIAGWLCEHRNAVERSISARASVGRGEVRDPLGLDCLR